jgi:uncharacterized glyoxalase superfamily protein PhnB
MDITGIGTHIKVKDFQKSKWFYKTLGFQQVFIYGPNETVKEHYNGIVFAVGNAKLEIGEGHVAVKPEVRMETVKSSKISLMINVDNINDLLDICKQHNIDVAVGPRHYYWNTIEVVLIDPDGVRLVFIAPYTPEEAKLVKADEKFGKPN